MKKQISCLLILLMTGILSATPIQGLQIESLNERVVVYLDGQQVSAPTFSCFIANLSYGTYRLEIFSAKDDYWRKNNCLYDSFISYRGGVEEVVIDVDNRYNNRHPHREQRIEMNDRDFDEFYNRYKNISFTSDKELFLDQTLMSASFTTDQCIILLKSFNFSSDKKSLIKKIYPNIVDKNNFYRLVDQLTFQSDKNEVYEYIKQYYDRR